VAVASTGNSLGEFSARRLRDASEKLVSIDASKRAPTTAPATVLHVNAWRAFKVMFFYLPMHFPLRAMRAALNDSAPRRELPSIQLPCRCCIATMCNEAASSSALGDIGMPTAVTKDATQS
jgi:hypothetical protein